MSLFEIIALLLALSACFSYLNSRFIALPNSIATMAFSLALSLVLIALNRLGVSDLAMWAAEIVATVDLGKTLLDGLLSFLLFAGALQVNVNVLYRQKWLVLTLATFGVLVTTFLVGSFVYWLLCLLNTPAPFIYCLLFGAVIAPTDPVAVMAILESIDAPKALSTDIAGESLFNDGVSVVTFLAILSIAMGQGEVSVESIGTLLLVEVVGGTLLGVMMGYISCHLLRMVSGNEVEILITLAIVTSGYAIANRLHMSGPLAVVIAGLIIAHRNPGHSISEETEKHLETFWEVIEKVLNAILFSLIGLEVLLINYSHAEWWVGLICIPMVLLARLISVYLPARFLLAKHGFAQTITALTWGGLRGGISVALALSIPAGEMRDLVLPMTYVIVIFSILVQGLTVQKVLLNQQ